MKFEKLDFFPIIYQKSWLYNVNMKQISNANLWSILVKKLNLWSTLFVRFEKLNFSDF